MGHGLETNEQRTGRRTDADLCSLRRTKQEQVGGAVGRARASLVTARASPNPAQKAMEQKQRENRERTEREAFEISSAALRPLHARSPLLPRPPPFIARKGAVRHSIPYLPNLPASILLGT